MYDPSIGQFGPITFAVVVDEANRKLEAKDEDVVVIFGDQPDAYGCMECLGGTRKGHFHSQIQTEYDLFSNTVDLGYRDSFTKRSKNRDFTVVEAIFELVF